MVSDQDDMCMVEEIVWKCMAVWDVFKDLRLISAKGLVYSYSNAYVCSRYVTPFHFTRLEQNISLFRLCFNRMATDIEILDLNGW
jgi:hypothetical protein